jgi:hypothetical protein
MPSIKQVQEKLAAFDRAARGIDAPDGFKKSWKRIFGKDLSDPAAKSFAQYYKEMRSKSGKRSSNTRKTHRGGRRSHRRAHTQRRRRQTGGVAPVHYQMVPGLQTNTYGSFPVEVDTDPASIKDLDVYFHDSLPLSKPGYWPQVPADMGSNKVGGAHRRGRKTQRRHRKQRGGNLLETLSMRPLPYIATPYPNMVQSAANTLNGGTSPVPTPPSPVNYAWELKGSAGSPINPGLVTNIGSNFNKLASPAPWQTSI